jgi:hypothetical protein
VSSASHRPSSRRVAPHDRRTAARIGAHLRFVLDGLHVHHSGEDELLVQRAALEGGIVGGMQSQHNALSAHIDNVKSVLAAGRRPRTDGERRAGRRAGTAARAAHRPPRRGGSVDERLTASQTLSSLLRGGARRGRRPCLRCALARIAWLGRSGRGRRPGRTAHDLRPAVDRA